MRVRVRVCVCVCVCVRACWFSLLLYPCPGPMDERGFSTEVEDVCVRVCARVRVSLVSVCVRVCECV